MELNLFVLIVTVIIIIVPKMYLVAFLVLFVIMNRKSIMEPIRIITSQILSNILEMNNSTMIVGESRVIFPTISLGEIAPDKHDNDL